MSRSALLPLLVFLLISLCLAETTVSKDRSYPEPWFEQVFDTGAYNLAITQDREGFLWVTTTGGLIRYDGYEKLVFTEGSGGLTSNFVPCVFEDSEGLLWIVTLSGLDVYDKKSGIISHVHLTTSSSDITESTTFNWAPRLVAEDQAGGIWIGSANGLFRHDKKLNTFERIDLAAGERSTPASHNIWTVLADGKGRIWVGTSAGLDRYNPETQTVTHFRHTPGVADSLGGGSVYAVYEDDQGTIWVGTGKGG